MKPTEAIKTDSKDITDGLSFLFTDYIHNIKLSGVLFCAVFLPIALEHFLPPALRSPILYGVAIWVIFSNFWKREIKSYKNSVSAELERRIGLERLETDFETVEWLNDIIRRIWLIFEPVLSDIIVFNVNDLLEYYTPAFLNSIRLSKFTLGTISPRLTLMKSFPKTDEDTVRISVKALFQPRNEEDLDNTLGQTNSLIVLNTRIGKGVMGVDIPVLVRDISFRAELGIQLKLMSHYPFIKTLGISFSDYPEVDFTLKPLKTLDIMDLPGLNNFLRKGIRDVSEALFVEPNSFVLDLDTLLNVETTFESAVGILLIKVHEARGLRNMEKIGLSDPYTVVKIGGSEVGRTRVIDNNLNPYWNECFYVLISNLTDKFELIIQDKDMLRDPVIGKFQCTLNEFDLNNQEKMDEIWKPLVIKDAFKDFEAKTKGQIHFEMHYYPVDESENIPDFPTGILRINIHEAKQLDSSQSALGQCNAFVETFYYHKRVHRSKMKKQTNKPFWEESFQLFIRDIKSDNVRFVIKDHRDLASDLQLGEVLLSVSDILKNLNSSPKIDWWTLRDAKCGRIRLSFSFDPVKLDHVVQPMVLDGKSSNIAPAIGVVKIKILKALGLKNQETMGVSDPYVEVTYLGTIRCRTEVVYDTLNPVWDETYYVLIQDTSIKGKLFFEVIDYNNISRDASMGVCELDLKSLKKEQAKRLEKERVLKIMRNDKQRGSLMIEASLMEAEQVSQFVDNSLASTSENLIAESSQEAASQLSLKVPSRVLGSNTGILRINIEEIELYNLEENSTDENNDPPSPYFEVYDLSGIIHGSETLQLSKTNPLKTKSSMNLAKRFTFSFPGFKKKNPKDRKSLFGSYDITSADTSKKFTLLHRTSCLKQSWKGKMYATFELFVENLESAHIILIAKDAGDRSANRKRRSSDAEALSPTAEEFNRIKTHKMMGKSEINLRKLIEETEGWFKITAIEQEESEELGKFKVSASYTPLRVNAN